MIAMFICGVALGMWIMWYMCITTVNQWRKIAKDTQRLNREMHRLNCDMLNELVSYSPKSIDDPIVKLN